MRFTIERTELARAVGAVGKVVETRNSIPILSNILLVADNGKVEVTGTDLDIQTTCTVNAEVEKSGRITVSAKLLNDIVRKAGSGLIEVELKDFRLNVKSGRSNFKLETLPASDFPDLISRGFNAEFEIDLAALFAPVSFAISTEETRYYLNGVFFRGVDGEASVAVATDGHRLARNHGPELPTFAGIIVPRKTVSLLPKGEVSVAVSDTMIRIEADDFIMVSKLIDGTFPDYERVIPRDNDKFVTVDRDTIVKASDRVSTVSSERGRAVKLSIAPGSIALHVSSPDSGSANDEVEAEYTGEPLDVGFNSQYIRDVFGAFPAGPVRVALRDSGSPALFTGEKEGLTLVLMPMRV